MKLLSKNGTFALTVAAILLVSASVVVAYQASAIPTSRLINPDELVKVLQSKAEKPLMIQVGSHVLYAQAHIPLSEYIGPASSDSGLQQLRTRVQPLPRNKLIVIYCGCCPWNPILHGASSKEERIPGEGCQAFAFALPCDGGHYRRSFL